MTLALFKALVSQPHGTGMHEGCIARRGGLLASLTDAALLHWDSRLLGGCLSAVFPRILSDQAMGSHTKQAYGCIRGCTVRRRAIQPLTEPIGCRRGSHWRSLLEPHGAHVHMGRQSQEHAKLDPAFAEMSAPATTSRTTPTSNHHVHETNTNRSTKVAPASGRRGRGPSNHSPLLLGFTHQWRAPCLLGSSEGAQAAVGDFSRLYSDTVPYIFSDILNILLLYNE